METNEYDKQAEDFLKETKTEFKAEFLKNDFHFKDDKEKRDIYSITLKKGNREFKFNFGNSLNSSVRFRIVQGYLYNDALKSMKEKGLSSKGCNTIEDKRKYFGYFIGCGNVFEENKNFKIPNAYDVLSCLTKNEVGSFKEFCDNFGYDDDSIKAEKTFKAVQEEYKEIAILYNDEEIQKLQEIN